jgi:hypothetical protein
MICCKEIIYSIFYMLMESGSSNWTADKASKRKASVSSSSRHTAIAYWGMGCKASACGNNRRIATGCLGMGCRASVCGNSRRAGKPSEHDNSTMADCGSSHRLQTPIRLPQRKQTRQFLRQKAWEADYPNADAPHSCSGSLRPFSHPPSFTCR